MMGRRIRRLIAVLLCIASIIILVVPSGKSYASTIVGDYEMDGSTLVKYNGKDDIITLPNTVQTIGKDAFSGNDQLVKVTMPDSVRTIDFAAFEDCTSLMQVVIPESVRVIGSSAFSGCEQLQYVNIPSKCEQIGSAAFAKCLKLTSLNVSPANSSYVCVDGVLYTSDGRKLVQYLAGRTKSSYNMPSGTESIEEYAFWGAPLLTDISLSPRLKEIPEYAFANCSGLNNVVIPYNVESLMAYSFSDCYNLKNVTVPDSVGYIDEKAFYLTADVKVNYYDSDKAREKAETSGVLNESFSDYVAGVSDDNAGIYDTNDSHIVASADEKEYINSLPYVSSMTPDYSDNKIPGELASAKIVGGEAMLLMPRDVRVRGFDPGVAESEDGVPYEYSLGNMDDSFIILNGTAAEYNGDEQNVSIPQGVKRIGNRVFYKESSISSVTLPMGLESIGDFAFARASLETVSIPEGVKEIGYAAFYNCEGLKEVSIPSSVERIELGAFDGTEWLSAVTTNSGTDFITVGNGILLKYTGNGGSVKVPDGIKVIAPGSFQGNTGITDVFLPDGVTTVGEDAFNGCSGLRDVSLPGTVTDIEDRAFKDCSLKNVIIPASVAHIGLGAFERQEDDDGAGDAVIFTGGVLPSVSYKNTATRLSAASLRTMPFAGYKNAIIGSDVSIDDRSILSPSQFGFRGQVYTMTGSDTEAGGTLKLIQADSEADPETGQAVIDPHVTVNGEPYIMTGVSESAFDPYLNVYDWSDKRIDSVVISGNTSPELDSALDKVNVGLKGQSMPDKVKPSEDGSVYIRVNMDESISPDKDEPHASITGESGSYHMVVTGSDEATVAGMAALASRYGITDGIICVPLNISLYDDRTGLPLRRLSGRKVDMELPIPTELTMQGNIMVAALDDNGMINEISSEIVNHGGNDKIRFVASHFSTYIFYSGIREEEILSEESMAANTQSVVIRTLNRNVGIMSVKWYIAVILLSMAAILILYKGKSRT
ncbi:MAG: leucine-rich repeat domain-containing protein [Lachnospiraceae bacterium]|nr:leucine-rich repeat domain-containing protein [Lachnospiraceae bacterium]